MTQGYQPKDKYGGKIPNPPTSGSNIQQPEKKIIVIHINKK